MTAPVEILNAAIIDSLTEIYARIESEHLTILHKARRGIIGAKEEKGSPGAVTNYEWCKVVQL